MLEDHLTSPITRKRLRAGLAADHIDGFADWLHKRGYAAVTIDTRLRSLASWAEWLRTAGFTADDFLSGFEACKAALEQGRVRHSRGPNGHSRIAAALFIAFLRDEGILALPAQARSPEDQWPILAECRSWMRQHHGLRDSTLDVYQGVVFDLLTWSRGTPQIYTAALVQDFVLQRAKPHGIWRAKSIVTAVRAFLRFLGATARCTPGLDQSIPGYASWRLSSVPRYLEPPDVQKVLDACSGNDAHGLRDRAVMLLLARLALRAGDVAGLALRDIDWKGGRIAVCGKGRRREWLPLPQDVGDAILKYIREGRRGIETDRVFVKVWAPSGALTRASVTHIARSALRRAGVKAPINGAHLFRHSAATAMLRQGASLVGVGAVLRHRSPSTTAHYAKVDFGLLAEIAQPWPEVPSC